MCCVYIKQQWWHDNKRLNFDLFYNQGTPFLFYEFIQIQNVMSQLIFKIFESFFQFSTLLEYFF